MTIKQACRAAWQSGDPAKIGKVAMGLRIVLGFDYDQVYAAFCKSVGREIPLADFDSMMYLADKGYSGPINTFGISKGGPA